MKILRLSLFALFTVAAAATVRAETFSYPAGGTPIFSVDVPNGWKPKANKQGRVEATSPDEDAYVELWVLKGKKADSIGEEIEEILESSVKNPKTEGEPKKASFGGLDGVLIEGHGEDKEDGEKVHFAIYIFGPTADSIGVMYFEYNDSAAEKRVSQMAAVIKSLRKGK